MDVADQYLPTFQFRERHSHMIAATPQRVMAAAQRYRPEQDVFFRRMIALREVPLRLLLRRNQPTPPPFGLDRFTLLAAPTDHAIAYGLIGKFWQADYGLVRCPDSAAFRAFDAAGTPRLLLTFTAEHLPQGHTRLQTETRVHCPDRASLLRFAPYWYVIRPVSGLIRQRMLRHIGRMSE